MRRSEVIVGLDLGSTRATAVAADVHDGDFPEVLGVGEAESQGIDAGVIVNMGRVTECVRLAIGRAEEEAQVEIGRVSVTVGGEHVKGIDSRGVIAVSRAGGEITDADVSAALTAAKTLALPVGRVILDVLPQEFFVDGQQGIRDPVGMTGVRLGSKAHVVTASQQAVDSVVKAVRGAGARVTDVVLKPLAAAATVLSDDEKELGVLLLNLGGGTTGATLYHAGAVRHTAVLGWGASSITSDIAVGLRIPLAKAEKLKREHGCARASLAGHTAVDIPSVGGRPPRHSSAQILSSIIEPRVREIFEMALSEAQEAEDFGRIQAGVILTGGGARLSGIVEAAEEVFGMPARVGVPDGVSGFRRVPADPAYAAAVGLVARAAACPGRGRGRRDGAISETVHRVREWVDSLL